MNKSVWISLILFVMLALFEMASGQGQDTSLESILKKTELLEGKEKIERQIELHDSLFNKSRYEKSVELIELMLSNPSLKNYDSLNCEVAFRKGEDLLFTSDFDSSILWLKKSSTLCLDANNLTRFGRSKQRLGNCYNQLGKFDTAMSCFIEAEEAFKKVNNQEALASLNNSIALLYGDTDRPLKSLEYLLKTLDYFDSVEDRNNLSVVQNNIGLLYYDQGDTNNAYKYYYQSIDNAEQTQNDIQLAKTYTNLGNLHSRLGSMDSAFIYYNKSLVLSQKTGSKYSLANLHYNLGQLYADMGNPDSAESHIKKSRDLCEALNIYEGLFFCNIGLGKVSELRKELSEAISFYHQAYDLATRFGVEKFKLDASSKLYEAYLKTEDYQNALKYFEEYHAISDSLLSMEKEKEFNQLTIQYETKLKDEENKRLKESNDRSKELLSQQNSYLVVLFLVLLVLISLIFILLGLNEKFKKANRELDSQKKILDTNNAQLEKVNQELTEVISIKDKLMSVISHDLRSPMASLQGLIALMQSDSLSREEFSQVIRKIETNLLNFSKFSDNILQWVKGQSHGITIKKENVPLCDLAEDAIGLHARQIELKEIKCELDCFDRQGLVFADLQSISIVLRNLISNAIKFSPIGGSVRIKIENTEEGIQCSITDSGLGMDKELIEKIHNKKPIMPSAGTSNEKGLGLGLSLCIEFLQLNDSELKISSEGGTGSTFSFILPQEEVKVKA